MPNEIETRFEAIERRMDKLEGSIQAACQTAPEMGKPCKEPPPGKRREELTPHVHIVNKDCVTRVYIDGEELTGVVGVRFSHDPKQAHHSPNMAGTLPRLELTLLADRLTIDAPFIPDLPDIYRSEYISARKLVAAGLVDEKSLDALL